MAGSSHSKKFFQMALSTALVTGAIVSPVPHEAAAVGFKDIKPTDRFYNEIIRLASRGVISGFSDGTFRPQENLTRAQAAKIICTSLKLNTKNIKNPNFMDLSERHWSYPYVAALVEKGIISGNGNHEFQPDELLTRAQMTKILALGFGFQESQVVNLPFKDVRKNDWFAPYLQSLFDQKVAYGTTPSAYSPEAHVTRGQMAAFVIRSEEATAEKIVSTSIVDLSGKYIETKAGTFELDGKEKEWLTFSNKQALKGSIITFTAKGNKILKVDSLVLTTDESIFDGNGAAIEAAIIVEAKNMSFKNIKTVHKVIIRKEVNKFSLTGDIDVLEVNWSTYKTSATKASEPENLELNIEGTVNVLNIAERNARLVISKKMKVKNLVLPQGATLQGLIENYQDIKKNIDQVNGEKNPDTAQPGGGGGSPAAIITAIEKIKVSQGLPLPAKVTVIMSNKTKREKEVAWPADLKTDTAGIFNIELTIEGKKYEAEVEIEENPDYQAAMAVSKLIENLPQMISLDDESLVNEAEHAFKQLTDNQKVFVSEASQEKLTNALNEMVQLKADRDRADEASQKIELLPDIIKLSDEEAINAAKEAYDDLTARQKAFISPENKDKLTKALERVAQLKADYEKAQKVSGKIAALPEQIDLTNEAQVNEVKEQYDQLTEGQKAFVEEKDKQRLLAAIERINELKNDRQRADEVIQKIAALPAKDELTLDEEAVVNDAKTAYDQLTVPQKELINQEAVEKLETLVQQLVELKADRDQADQVTEKIAALPENIQLADESKINEAKAAYDQLTLRQQSFVSETNKQKLTRAIDQLEKLKADHRKAVEVMEKIAELPAIADLTLENEAAVNEAKSAYDDLTADQQAFVSAEATKKLADALDKMNSLKQKQSAISAANEAINQLPEPNTISLANLGAASAALDSAEKAIQAAREKGAIDADFTHLDKVRAVKEMVTAFNVAQQIEELNKLEGNTIKELRNQYNQLSDEQKVLVSNIDKLAIYEQALLVTQLNFDQNGEAFLPTANDITVKLSSVQDENGHTVNDVLSISNGKVIAKTTDQEQTLKVIFSLTKGSYSVQTNELIVKVPAVDRTSPVFLNGYPKTENIQATSFDLAFKTNEISTVYYLVVEDGASAPTVNQVKQPESYTGSITSGNLSAEEDTEQNVTITELEDGMKYSVYMVAEDESGNIHQSPVRLDIETAKLPSVVSKEITNFDFSTIYAGQAQLHSKPMTTSDFSGANKKVFTVSDGNVTITVDLDWNIPQNEFATTAAVSIGSAIESKIQDYCNAHGIPLQERTMSARGWGDTVTISTFKAGASNQVVVGGPDWQYFFNTNIARGTEEDTSKNRTFTISDGKNTATVKLAWNSEDIDGLISDINGFLEQSGVEAIAKKVNDKQFKIVAKSTSINLSIGGANKVEFFTDAP